MFAREDFIKFCRRKSLKTHNKDVCSEYKTELSLYLITKKATKTHGDVHTASRILNLSTVQHIF